MPARRVAAAAARLMVARDLKLAFRKRGQLVQPLIFFAIVTALFPLGVSPELSRLREIAPGVLWIGGVVILAAGARVPVSRRRARRNARAVRAVGPVADLAAVREDGRTLAADRPAAGADGAAGGTVAGRAGGGGCRDRGSVAIGSVALSLIGSIGAALTLGVRRSGALLSLLTLPLSVPVLIFGARATELAIKGESYRAPL